MSLYENFNQKDLVDLLDAYDSYIATAVDAGLLNTGWTPVCVEEFYGSEYQNVWRQGGSFDYMYESDPTFPLFHIVDAPGAHVFLDSTKPNPDNFVCSFEESGGQMKPLRSRIQDIREGDAFIGPDSAIYCACEDAHQNLDEPDSPWIVYDEKGNSWFSKDIIPPIKGLSQLMETLSKSNKEKSSLNVLIDSAKDKTSNGIGTPIPEKER